MTNLEKLLLNASPSLSEREPEICEHSRKVAGVLADQLFGMLCRRNGFYALESALHVFPAQSNQHEIGMVDWNESVLWRSDYRGMADGCLFFAEDVFGGQCCIKDNKIYTFDPETGGVEFLADDIESWAQILLSDYEVLTGYPLAHQWQEQNGKLPAAKRLLPKVPFILGGEFVLENLYLADAVKGMKSRANIANQIKNLPDGAGISFNFDG
ncbi:SMI1/KNR4 family protein [Pseudomonas sp. SDO52101_S400]